MRSCVLAACAALALLCWRTDARAGETAGDVDFFQQTLGDIMDTPILAASYAEERPSDTAATAYVITADMIAKRGYSSLVDLLNDTPQFQIQRNSDARRLNLVSVRGIPNNERLVILYDGVRVTPPTGDLMTLAGQFSLKDAERVEIVLGPMSSLYGADAFSGVVNVVTRGAASLQTSASYGSFSSLSGNVSAAGALPGADPKATSASLTYAAAAAQGPALPAFYRKDYAWYNDQYQRGLAQISPNNSGTTPVVTRPYDARETSSFLNLRMVLDNFDAGLIKMGESHSSSIGVKPELTQYVKDARFATDYWTVYGRHSYVSTDETWHLTSLAAYYDYEIAPETQFINSFSSYGPAYKYARSQIAYVQETLAFEPLPGLPALAGFNYQENAVLPYASDLGHKFVTGKSPLSQGFTYSGSTIPVDFYSLNYSNTGAFLRLQTRDLGRVSLSVGLRYDYNTAYGTTWNPRAGLVWKPGEEGHTVVKVLYGEAYLAPSPFYTHKHFGSFYSVPISGADPTGYRSWFFHVPNPDLDPEKLRSVEASISQDFGHAMRLSMNPYYNKVRNLIQDVSTGPGTFHGVNVADIEMAKNQGMMETYGGTLRADGVLRSGRWSFEPWGAYTYSEGRLSGKFVPFNSLHTLQAGVSAMHAGWSMTPKVLHRSASRDQDGVRVPQFVTADLTTSYACHRVPGLVLHLQLQNIFDRRYYNAAYGGGADHLDGAPQQPFSMTGGLAYKF
ncbi:MAG: TonB-dependent receptor [Elusimicrobia bacterium]|nr:TonB-dependent receptor [Elusimicrobiota bacterium]